MSFIFILALLIFLYFLSTSGEQHPFLYLISTGLYLIFAAIFFTAPGNDWVNNLLGFMMFFVAVSNGNDYKKYRRKHY